MKNISIVTTVVIAALVATSCAWNNSEAELWRQRESGKISQQEYDDALQKLHDSGAKSDEPPIADFLRDVAGGASSDEVGRNHR